MKLFWSQFKRQWAIWLASSLLVYSTLAAVVYFFWQLSEVIAITCLALSFGITYILEHFGLFFNENPVHSTEHWRQPSFITSTLLFFAIIYLILANNTQNSIISPWEVAPLIVFPLFAFFVFLCLKQARPNSLNLIAFLAIFASVIPAIYQLGYGYDFFIHQATLKKIIEAGEILPKTPYYLGQYALLYLLSLSSTALANFIHLWLVPLTSFTLLPFIALRENFDRRVVLLLFVLPLPFLTFTTPQNLGLVLLLAEVLCLIHLTKSNLTLASLLTLANLTIHPLSGIPALALLLISYFAKFRKYEHLSTIIGAGLPILLPLALLISGFATIKPTALFLNFWTTNFSLSSTENIVLNFVYSWGFNLTLIVLLFIFIGIKLKHKHLHNANLTLALGLLVASFLIRQLSFKGVIDYEQADFSKRLIIEGLIILVPVFLLLATWLINKINQLPRREQVIWFIFLSCLITTSWYLSYPRHDHYFNSRGLSVSAADLEAVSYIDDSADGQDYIVLANQQVSAAALKLFGFAHYYQDNFYYPIPTTNPLYTNYLSMVNEKPSAETIKQAMNISGVNKGYFILNRYWQDFPKLLEQAKMSSVSYRNFRDQTYVFEFNK